MPLLPIPLPPHGSVNINNGASYTNSASVTLNLSAKDNTKGSDLFQMQFSNDNSIWSAPEAYATTKSWTLSSGDGTKTVYVKYKDAAGNWSRAYSDTIIFDITPPTGTVSINNAASATNTISVTLNLSAADAGSGMGNGAQMQFSSDNVTWSTAQTYVATKSWTLSSGDGTKTVYVKYKDAAGNWSAAYSDTIILDTGLPTGSIEANNGSPYTNSALVILNLSAVDSGSGLLQMQFSSNNSKWSTPEAYVATRSWTLSSRDGVKAVYVKYGDTAGNWSVVYSASITLDTAAPTGTIKINNGATSTASTSVTLNLTASDSRSGLSQMQFSNDNIAWSTAEDYSTTKSYTLTSGNGAKTVYAKFKDAAGNWSIAYSATITLAVPDTTPPTGSILINDGATSTTSQTVTLTLSAADTDSGMGAGAQMQFSNDNIAWSTAEDYSTTKSYTLTSGNGAKTVYAKFKDAAGNWSIAYSATITLAVPDTTPPTGSITINNNEQYTNSLSVTLNLSAQDNAGGSGMSQMQFSNNNSTWSALEPYSTTKSWTLTAGDGTKTVYVKFSDKLGNWSSAYSDLITLDITPPSQPTIDTVRSPTNVTSQAITGTKSTDTVTITVTSSAATVGQVTYPTSTTWSCQLTNLTEGTNNISVIAQDPVGNQSIAATAGILLDTTAPVIVITSPENGSTSSTQTIIVSGTINDNQAAVIVNGIAATVSNGTFTANNVTLTQGSNTITATATDLAGNSSSNSITVIYQPAVSLSIAIISPANNASVTTSTITVSGTVTDNTATVTVNGISTTVTDYTFSALDIPLTQGTNIITATAVNDTSNAQATINVILDTTPPSISIYIPDANSTTRSNIVYGKASDNTKIVVINGAPAEILSDFRFIGRPALTEGANTITVTAANEAGNASQSLNITYDTQTPKVTIISPADNSTINISPIKVIGKNTQEIIAILVNDSTAVMDDTGFSAEGVALNPFKTVITAFGYDSSNNVFSDSILINSPAVAHYELTKVSGDAEEYDDSRPVAGSNQVLKVMLNKNGETASGEEVEFKVEDGKGALSGTHAFTDTNGEAQVTLTTDTDSDITNKVVCSSSSNPLVKSAFSVDTKPAQPSILKKITDETITPLPGTTIPLIMKLTDSNDNPIQDETINFQVTNGAGTISSPTAVTTHYGEAGVNLTCPDLGLALTRVIASSQTVPAVSATFNITTSAPLAITADDIVNKINANDEKIEDMKADINVTSNAQFLPPSMQLKMWQKGDLQKIEEISPTPGVSIRPPLSTTESIQMDRQILSQDPNSGIYIIKSKVAAQTEEKPYELWYIDYGKGIILKEEDYYNKGYIEMLFTTEYSEFVQLPEADNAWAYNKKTEKIYEGQNNPVSTTTITVIGRQVNTGIPDAEFQ